MIPVLFCGNKKIFKGIFLCALSMARRTKEPLKIYIFSMDYTKLKPEYTPITEGQMQFLNDMLKSYNSESFAVIYDLTDDYIKAFEGGKTNGNEYTPYALIRLFADNPSLIPEDKLIYLDCDTMCYSDIKELYDIDVSEYEYGAVVDYMGKFWIAQNYCNSGVLLLNLKMVRETGLLEKCRKKLYVRWYEMSDQSALHKMAIKRMYLPSRFNEQRSVKPDTVIKHFNRGIRYFPFFHLYNVKQWQFDKVHKVLKIYEFDEDFEIYKNLTKDIDIDNL